MVVEGLRYGWLVESERALVVGSIALLDLAAAPDHVVMVDQLARGFEDVEVNAIGREGGDDAEPVTGS